MLNPDEIIYDGEHCPLCRSTSYDCGHAMTHEDMLDEFAAGLPILLARRLDQIETSEEIAALDNAPVLLKHIVSPTRDEEVSRDYWSTDPGVVKAFFIGDRPGGSGLSYWHADAQSFELMKRVEALQALDWLDKHLPQLAERQQADASA